MPVIYVDPNEERWRPAVGGYGGRVARTLREYFMNDHGQPIDAWAAQQNDLTANERAAIIALPGVWTVGDMQHKLGAGELDMALAAKVAVALGLAEPKARKG